MAVSRRSMLWMVPGATIAVPLGTMLLADRAHAAQVNAEDGIAVRGTDVVAYVTAGRPAAGRAEFAHRWEGATWLFASAANRDLFAADPARYAPAYGGFCAYAVSEGYTAPIDPNAWRIVDGRLYLNYDRSVQRRWERDIPGRIARANDNWPRLSAR
jgi:YHS domain-containing protein